MATKKQQRRRQKLQRHEYVYLDAEGNEVEPPKAKPEERSEKAPAKATTSRGGAARREPKPPSWPRAVKWAGGYAAAFFVLTLVVSRKASIGAVAVQVLFLGVVMIPGMYLMHRLQYRTFHRVTAKQAGRKPGTGAKR